MRVHYDQKIDASYIHLENFIPESVGEIKEEVHSDTTEDARLAGIEFLDASKMLIPARYCRMLLSMMNSLLRILQLDRFIRSNLDGDCTRVPHTDPETLCTTLTL